MNVLRQPIIVFDLTPGQKAAICNGCGPRSWKFHGHSWRWRWLALPTPGASSVCDQHDLDYWLGGLESDRVIADQRLRDGMLAVADTKWWGARWLLEAEAHAFFDFVRSRGAAHFRSPPMRTRADLPDV